MAAARRLECQATRFVADSLLQCVSSEIAGRICPALKELSALHRLLAHVLHVELDGLRRSIAQAEDHTELRIQYIISRMEEQLTRAVYKKDAPAQGCGVGPDIRDSQ